MLKEVWPASRRKGSSPADQGEKDRRRGLHRPRAAKLSGSAWLGILSRGTAVIHQKDLAPLQTWSSFPSALIEADTFRPSAPTPPATPRREPLAVPVRNDPMVRPSFQDWPRCSTTRGPGGQTGAPSVEVASGARPRERTKMPSANREQIANILGYMAQTTPIPTSRRVFGPGGGADHGRPGGGRRETPPPAAAGRRLGPQDYPLGQKRKDLIQSSGGLGLDAITWRRCRRRAQSTTSRSSPRPWSTSPDRRKRQPSPPGPIQARPELTRLPDQRVLEIYNMLRPYRCTKAELLALPRAGGAVPGQDLRALVREAAEPTKRTPDQAVGRGRGDGGADLPAG